MVKDECRFASRVLRYDRTKQAIDVRAAGLEHADVLSVDFAAETTLFAPRKTVTQRA